MSSEKINSFLNLDEMPKYFDDFENFLKKKYEEGEKQKAEASDRKNQWITSVEALYKDIKELLRIYEDKKLLFFYEQEIELEEEFIGKYKIKKLEITFSTERISLIPRATYVVGFFGKVDMVGLHADCMILQKEWGVWKFGK
ncbi:MAG TPA: hypothetical protein VNW06_00185, partial [Cytophagaceae bacterium]|nr:hypothetical protein [Cytophagaceae bacterium]